MRFKTSDIWEEIQLSEIANYVNEKVSIDICTINKYISTTNMIENKGGTVPIGDLPKTKSVNSFKVGDVLISNIRPYFKKIWFATFDGTSSTDVLVLRGKEHVYNKFLYYILSNNAFFDYSTKTAKGTKMPRGDKKAIMDYKVPKLKIKEQKVIADILSSLDTKIELNNKITKNLEEQAQAIFKHWFVDFEFPDENGNPYKSSGGEMIESELGIIPKGWGVCRLEEIADITMGQSPKGTTYNELGEGVVFYQGRTDFTSRFPHRRLYTTDPKRMASQGDILMSVRAPVGDINIANEDCCIGRGLCSLNSKGNMNSYLLYTLLKLKDQYNIYNGEGTVFGSINQKELKGLKVIKPVKTLIEKYDKLVSSMDRKYWVLDKENRALTKLRDTLLPKLMSGELRIPLD